MSSTAATSSAAISPAATSPAAHTPWSPPSRLEGPDLCPASVPTSAPVPVLGTESWWTVPNLVTAVRTVAAVVLGGWAVGHHDLKVLAVAYAVYWIGDMADGWSARRLGQATRAGAVFDIVSDRACTFVLAVGALSQTPTLWPVATVFLLSFGVVDTVLSLVFLYWPLKSPNDFHRIDRAVWRVNWSPAAKGLNTAGVVLAVAAGYPGAAFALAVAVLAVKVWSLHRVAGLLTGRLTDQLPVR